MEIKHIVREAVKSELYRRGDTLAAAARRHRKSRQLANFLLADPVSEVGATLACVLLGMTRAQLEALVIAEWRRAEEAGLDVRPPRMMWQTMTGQGVLASVRDRWKLDEAIEATLVGLEMDDD